MNVSKLVAALATCFIGTVCWGQAPATYQVPITEYGQPDFQGV